MNTHFILRPMTIILAYKGTPWKFFGLVSAVIARRMDKFGDSPSFFIGLFLNKEFLAKVKHPEELKNFSSWQS